MIFVGILHVLSFDFQKVKILEVLNFHQCVCIFSHSYAFRLAAVVGTGVDNYFELIEDIIAQADEVDDQYLQVSLYRD